jgi:uncharacterized protein
MLFIKQVGYYIVLFWIVLTSASCQNRSSQSKVISGEPADSLIDFRFRNFTKGTVPKPVGYVNDFENIFSLKEEQVLDSLIKDFERKTTIEIAVVTIDTTMLSQSTLFDYTLELANTWGVGKKDKKNGILIGICTAKKDFRIQNGFGIEPFLSDSATAEIMNHAFFPSYKKGQVFDGTLLGIKALMQTLETNIEKK